MGVQFECFSKACAGTTVVELVANEVVTCPACSATYLFDGTETKRVDEQGKPLSDEAIDNWETNRAHESESGGEKATSLCEDGLPRGVAKTAPVQEEKGDVVDSDFNVVARTSAELLKLISALLFVGAGLMLGMTIFLTTVAEEKAVLPVFCGGLFLSFVVFSVAYLFRAISYLQRGQLRILEKLEQLD